VRLLEVTQITTSAAVARLGRKAVVMLAGSSKIRKAHIE
jgi:hypothetical protein